MPKDFHLGTIVIPLILSVSALPPLMMLAGVFSYALLRGQWLPRFGGGTWTGFVPASVAPGILLALMTEFHVAYAG
ncbi:hypothetical protein [Streptomyces sp. MP131-18]|uniref:hypothetical protein n=1 Tax=Streptomyces sp. MP131-18 TaxID=1857892 RepID=UPI0009C9801D|nr:hypothetical protein [Streptomyces sp. MP131-18]ONK16104.1 hypothetical protein STBA_69540 [Streptomyces sp. MP131-18]